MNPPLIAFIGLSLATPTASDYAVVVRDGRTTVCRYALAVETGTGPLAEVERELLAGHTPSPDGSNRLDRLLDGGRLLRIDTLPRHPHAATITAALFAALDGNGNGAIDDDEARVAERRLLSRFDGDGDGCLVPLEIAPGLLTAVPPTVPTGLSVTICRLGEMVPGGVPSEVAGRVTLRIGSRRDVRLGIGNAAVEFASLPRWHGASAEVPRSLTLPGREADRARFAAVAECVATLTVRPEPRGWFERLDANGDGQLSTRELRAAAKVLATLPDPKLPAVTLMLTPGVAARPPVPFTLTPQPADGPKWFQSLDRNADGDVNRDEFTGPVEDFHRYDVDDDGLISAAEAVAGDRKRLQEHRP